MTTLSNGITGKVPHLSTRWHFGYGDTINDITPYSP